MLISKMLACLLKKNAPPKNKIKNTKKWDSQIFVFKDVYLILTFWGAFCYEASLHF
jgi:hypothetical protein